MAVQNPVHFDIVGSFLRPERLKKAREAFRSGALGQAGLRRVEDEEIRKLISKEKALGLRTLTDGEFRREYWHLDFMWGLGGIKRETLSHGYFFEGEETGRDTAVLTGKLSGDHHPIVDDFRFTQQFAYQNTVVKETLPAPRICLMSFTGRKTPRSQKQSILTRTRSSMILSPLIEP